MPPTPEPPSPYLVRFCRLANGDQLPLLCRNGLPDYATTEWTLSSLWPEGNATNTMAAKLRAVGHWFRWCQQDNFNWEDRVKSGMFLTSDEIAKIAKWMRTPIGKPAGVKVFKFQVADGIVAARMGFVCQFLRWLAEPIIHKAPEHAHDRLNREFQIFQTRWAKRTPDASDSRTKGERFGLTSEQQNLFQRVIDPGCQDNPFEPGMRVRNHAFLLMLFEHGLRMAEPLLLKTQDILFGERQFLVPGRRNDPQDPRRVLPSPKKGKNHQQVGGRLLKFSPASMKAMERWLNEDRRDGQRFPGARKSPFVFVSERGLPLSVRRVHSMFETIRNAFPALGVRFTPHTLRHTFVEEYIRNHPQFTAKQRQDLIYLLDWTQASRMPERYGLPAIQESAGKATMDLSEKRRARAAATANKEDS